MYCPRVGVPLPSNAVLSSTLPLLVGKFDYRVSVEKRWLLAKISIILQVCVEPLSGFWPLPALEGKDSRRFHFSQQLRVENYCFEGNMRKQSPSAGP